MSGRSLALAVIGAGAGAMAWTATEYGMHRWVLHGPFGKGRLSRVPLGAIHRNHHRDPVYTSLAGRTAGHLAIAGIAAAAAAGLGSAVQPVLARSMAAAWAAGYSTYELTHWNAHHRPARTAWGEQLRARHMRHHAGAPASNLGVTMNWWDRLLDTEAPTSRAAA